MIDKIITCLLFIEITAVGVALFILVAKIKKLDLVIKQHQEVVEAWELMKEGRLK